jgi:prepilin-type N-terminal cleavage/methylation domain-containing protein/prepilin-type processing-associated H-X9-DG protein
MFFFSLRQHGSSLRSQRTFEHSNGAVPMTGNRNFFITRRWCITCVRSGISLIELLVVVAVLGLLVAIAIPAVQQARNAARRMECSSHLRQIGIAIAGYESIYSCFPVGVDLKRQLLPYVEQQSLYDAINASAQGRRFPDWARFEDVVVPIFLCPSDPAPPKMPWAGRSRSATSYAGCYGSGGQIYGANGMFNSGVPYASLPGCYVRPADVIDGLSNTAAVAEILHGDGTPHRLRVNWFLPQPMQAPNELDAFASRCASIPPEPAAFGYLGEMAQRGVPWFNGSYGLGLYNHILQPNRPSCINGGSVPLGAYTAASLHAQGANVLFGDGRVDFLSAYVDLTVWREMGSRVAKYP